MYCSNDISRLPVYSPPVETGSIIRDIRRQYDSSLQSSACVIKESMSCVPAYLTKCFEIIAQQKKLCEDIYSNFT